MLHPIQGSPWESALSQVPGATTDSGGKNKNKKKTTEAQQFQTQQHMVLKIKQVLRFTPACKHVKWLAHLTLLITQEVSTPGLPFSTKDKAHEAK